MDEIWKPVPSLDGYLASNIGRIKGRKDQILNGYRNEKGYCLVNVVINGKYRMRKVHRLVMEAFVGPSKKAVDHINAIREDNRLENLRYVTAQENAENTKRLKRFRTGTKSQFSKLTKDQVYRIRSEINVLNRSQKVKEFSREFGVSQATIYKIFQGHYYTDVTVDLKSAKCPCCGK